jgi:DNA-binding CsgD family transcriptional regulator
MSATAATVRSLDGFRATPTAQQAHELARAFTDAFNADDSARTDAVLARSLLAYEVNGTRSRTGPRCYHSDLWRSLRWLSWKIVQKFSGHPETAMIGMQASTDSDDQGFPRTLRHAQGGAPWSAQGAELAGPHYRSEEPAVAVGYALLCGVMVAQGRFEDASHWLGRVEHILQPKAVPGIGADRTGYADLISEFLGLLAQRDGPVPQGSELGRASGEARRKGAQAICGGVARPPEVPTEAETRVLRYLPTHLCAREIGDELHLSPNTVKTHMRHLYQKLDAHNRGQAVERARAFGLLAPRPDPADTNRIQSDT